MNEVEEIKRRYERRASKVDTRRYHPLQPAVYMAANERHLALIRWLAQCGLSGVDQATLFEVGCGSGNNLLELLLLGFQPQNLVGNELLPDRIALARRRLPAQVALLPGDASELSLPFGSFDIVFQSTVFTSILDPVLRSRLAVLMWAWAKPGGGILWYDFVYDNPRNADVQGVPVSQVRSLFPEGSLRLWRLTLAPPISRTVTRLHPCLYSLFNLLPFLRTHVLCWIRKPVQL